MSEPHLLWDCHLQAWRLPDGSHRVRLTGKQTGEVREREGYNPLWELIRLIGQDRKGGDDE